MSTKIIIAGGGIGGLSLALSLHQIGLECTVLEGVKELKPLGVGINLQPNAVRELMELGFTRDDMSQFGIPAKEWALVGLKGQEIYAEPRGELAGYNWPQYAAHRGQFHMALYERLVDVAGTDTVQLDCKVTSYEQLDDGKIAVFYEQAGKSHKQIADILIGADGIHSAIRAQLYPHQPPIHWGGCVMWRGTTLAKPIRTGSSFVGLGTHLHRVVVYPISEADPITGLALINWIAEVTFDDPSAHERIGWYRQVKIDDFVHYFNDWTYDWLNVPELIRGANAAFENPMIDRDPIPSWVSGSVALLGDAAHPMYPTGSNGASQAIIDGRVLCAKFLEHGVTPKALQAYDEQLCGPVSEVVLRNRGAGPFGLLNMVNDRCDGEFDHIDDVISPAERTEFMQAYQKAAGFARDTLNEAQSIIPPLSRFGC